MTTSPRDAAVTDSNLATEDVKQPVAEVSKELEESKGFESARPAEDSQIEPSQSALE